MPDHTLTRFDADLADLRALLVAMIKIVRKNIKQSLQALREDDLDLAEKVIKQDEAANALEVQADEAARALIVRHQPAASDLRFVFAATKIVTDLERMSDLAVNIAQDVLRMKERRPQSLGAIPDMQDLILDQLKNVRDAYLNRDTHLAQTVIAHDQRINEAFTNTQRVMLTYMAENPGALSQYMALINIAKVLERIGDHITNIAEMVIYTVIGHEVRHIDHGKLAELLSDEDDDE